MMKPLFYILFVLSNTLFLHGQEAFFTQLKPDAYIFANGKQLKDETAQQQYISTFDKTYTYHKDFDIAVNDRLNYEMGTLKSKASVFSVLFIRSKNSENATQIELLVIDKKEKAKEELAAIKLARTYWMKLCNAHQADSLVSNLYDREAYYYNRGRLLQGTKALQSEYSYMNSPNYSLKLTPKQVTIVNATTAYELGRCSGSYPLPYLLVWKKQADATWKIVLDSNF